MNVKYLNNKNKFKCNTTDSYKIYIIYNSYIATSILYYQDLYIKKNLNNYSIYIFTFYIKKNEFNFKIIKNYEDI